MQRCGILLVTPKDGGDRFVCLSVHLDKSFELAKERAELEETKLLEECKPSDLYARRKYWQDEFDAGKL